MTKGGGGEGRTGDALSPGPPGPSLQEIAPPGTTMQFLHSCFWHTASSYCFVLFTLFTSVCRGGTNFRCG